MQYVHIFVDAGRWTLPVPEQPTSSGVWFLSVLVHVFQLFPLFCLTHALCEMIDGLATYKAWLIVSISGPPCTYVRMYCTCLSSPAQVPKMTLWRTTWWRTWTTPLCPREGGTSCWFGTDWPKGHVPLPGRSLSGACTSSTSRWEKRWYSV